MSDLTIRPAYSKWPDYHRSLRDVVAGLTEAQLALTPSPERWPLWATVGHAASQRVFWLCDFAGQPGAGRSLGLMCPTNGRIQPMRSRPRSNVEGRRDTSLVVEPRRRGGR
jgi:hypothetical protein